MKNLSFSRREFVRLFTGGTAAVLISFNTACKNKISQWRYLGEEEISRKRIALFPGTVLKSNELNK